MSEWNPDLYLKFEQERTQPVKDLIFRIKKGNPKRIIDIGCGPGNSTSELKKRWPDAYVVGLDNSEAMLEKAKKNYPDLDWVLGDANKDLSFLGKFDIVFSNAAIQWMPDQNELLIRLFSMVNGDGVLAVQIPNPGKMPISIAVHKSAQEYKWRDYFTTINDGMYYEELSYYYDTLSALTNVIELWETQYNHIMPDHRDIIEWYKSTGMKFFLDKLPGQKVKDDFADDILAKIQMEYEQQKDGNILFPFRRLFFIAYKV